MADGGQVELVELDDEQIYRMTIPELKVELRRRQVKVTGKKRELQGRLRAALALKREHGARGDEEDDENDEDDEDEVRADGNDRINDDQEEERVMPGTRRRRTTPRVFLTFKDVEEALAKFSGDGNSSVHRWLEDFEGMVVMCDWNDLQKVTHAKQLLTGPARLFVNYVFG